MVKITKLNRKAIALINKKYILDPLEVKQACTEGNLRVYVSGNLIYITDIENGETAIIGNVNSKVDNFMDFERQ